MKGYLPLVKDRCWKHNAIFECNLCHKSCISLAEDCTYYESQARIDIINHMIKEHGKHCYKCYYCSDQFITKYSLKEHERSHKAKPKCDICDDEFTWKKELAEHMKEHKKIKKVKKMAVAE